MTPSDAVERLRRAIQQASAGDGAHKELEEAARALVTELRGEQQPPEQVLLRIKRILGDAGLRPSYGDSSEGAPLPGSHAAIYRELIAMSIRQYYDGRDP